MLSSFLPIQYSFLERCSIVLLLRTAKLEEKATFRFDIETKHKVMAGFCFDIESECNFWLTIETIYSFLQKISETSHGF
jgi:hypothetical protein